MLRHARPLLSVALVLSACACSASSGGAPATAHSYNGVPVLVQPHPRTVTPTLDKASAVSVALSANGGTVSATGTDGTTFSLALPNGALADSEIVTLTPISHLAGAPLSVGPIEGVQIEPDGLVLAKPAVLTIVPKPQMAPLSEQVGFGFHASGTDFYLQHLDPVAPISLHIMHFCADGVGGASPGDLQSQSTTPPTQSFDQEAQAIVEAVQATVAQARQAELLGQPVDNAQLQATIDNLKEQYYDSVLAPLLALAESDPGFVSDALVLSLQYLRNDQLLGEESRHYKDVESAWEKVFQNEISRVVCDAARGNATIVQYLGVSRQAQLLGFPDPTESENVLGRCLVFQLDFDAESQFGSPTGAAFDTRITMHGLRLAPAAWTGHHDVDLMFGAPPPTQCHFIHNQHQTETFSVTQLQFDLRLVEREGMTPPQLQLTGLALVMHPGDWVGDDVDDCANAGT
ncbi:MAG: hypothetical protein JOY80_00005, partial [Candidatus Dormibacteraeota bacterium]|nr:hypothetical protein [Candidatus Dormibacteraeota bacterium]